LCYIKILYNQTDIAYTVTNTSLLNISDLNLSDKPIYLGNLKDYTATHYMKGKKYRTYLNADKARTVKEMRREASKFGF